MADLSLGILAEETQDGSLRVKLEKQESQGTINESVAPWKPCEPKGVGLSCVGIVVPK